MTPEQLIKIIKTHPDRIEFTEVIESINVAYTYTPTRFHNGIDYNAITNEAGSNEGSCKIFAFARLHNLNKEQTLACFGKYYREEVLGHPNDNNHTNIRNFMVSGWKGIKFKGQALHPK